MNNQINRITGGNSYEIKYIYIMDGFGIGILDSWNCFYYFMHFYR